jgi:hypothetical protein
MAQVNCASDFEIIAKRLPACGGAFDRATVFADRLGGGAGELRIFAR